MEEYSAGVILSWSPFYLEARMKITVSTGGHAAIVEAADPYEAVKQFFIQEKVKSAGLVASCVSDELDDTYYVNTQRVLEELGMWGGTQVRP